MGERLRLRRDSTSRLPRQARIVARALRRYGMLVADNGSDWYISGAPNPAGTTTRCTSSARIRGADFEVVRTG